MCPARRHDSDLPCATRQTGRGVNLEPPLNAEEAKILALVGTDPLKECGGRRVGVAPRVDAPAVAGSSRGNGSHRPCSIYVWGVGNVALLSHITRESIQLTSVDSSFTALYRTPH